VIAAPPSGGDALIVTSIHVDVTALPAVGGANNVGLIYGPANSTARTEFYEFFTPEVTPATVGETTIPLDAGLAIPAGWALCGFIGGTMGAQAWASGYTVPSAPVPAAHSAALPERP
jgi:hypothetical protein